MDNYFIIAGVGFNCNDESISSLATKLNIGAAIAKKMVEMNYNVILLSRTQAKLKLIKEAFQKWYPNSTSVIETYAIDLLNAQDVDFFANSLKENTRYHYIHSAGLGAGNYNVNNPYLKVENTPNDLPVLEFEAITKSLLIMVKALLPKFRKQDEARVVVIDSMSSIRPYPYGFSHSSAKAGLHNAVRSLTLELSKENIYFSEINPGMTDTGGYDDKCVQDSVREISKTFGYEYDKLPLMPPESVAETVLLCLQSQAHILEIDLVSKGQFPHIGA